MITFAHIDATDRDGNPLGEVYVNIAHIREISVTDEGHASLTFIDGTERIARKGADFIVTALAEATRDGASVVIAKDPKQEPPPEEPPPDVVPGLK